MALSGCLPDKAADTQSAQLLKPRSCCRACRGTQASARRRCDQLRWALAALARKAPTCSLVSVYKKYNQSKFQEVAKVPNLDELLQVAPGPSSLQSVEAS